MRNRRKATPQKGSLKIWHNPTNNTVWASIDVHAGRVTQRVRGREARDPDVAVDLLRSAVNGEDD